MLAYKVKNKKQIYLSNLEMDKDVFELLYSDVTNDELEVLNEFKKSGWIITTLDN